MDIMMLASAWPSNVEGWVTLITLIVGLIGAIAALVPTIIKMVKALRELIKNKQWQKIVELAINAMKEAEGLFQEGTDKLEYAMKTLKAACKELNNELDDILNIDMSDFGFDLGVLDSDEFGTDFELPDGDKGNIEQITFTLASEQATLIRSALDLVKDETTETFGNENKNGNAIYEVVRQWVEQKK